MGTALDLVGFVERVSGRVPETRGDRQFRLYVYLKPGAVNKLYAAKEFRRGRDNTVYHIGYPINFRQQGGVPSVQISVARTGRRADIDVDYRSSRMRLSQSYMPHIGDERYYGSYEYSRLNTLNNGLDLVSGSPAAEDTLQVLRLGAARSWQSQALEGEVNISRNQREEGELTRP